MTPVSPDLVRGVHLLSLDAGNTVIFLDHERLARVLTREGFATDARTLIRAEGDAKLAAERKLLTHVEWSAMDEPGAKGWGAMVATIALGAGVPDAELPALLGALWKEHVDLNFWSVVPEGLGTALDRIRARGVRVAIVSNSEGMLEPLFRRLGIRGHFDVVVDSGIVGVEKPDPRIFEMAMLQCNTSAAHTLHLGDMYATDTLGAHAAGIRTALIDPYGHLEGRHVDVPRVPGVVAVADAIFAERTAPAAR
jgi:putative hydrolase of the HAD superfamily